ncbi:MAG: CcoQ/FixQ family Cbb3-type cytochrome c oxidase assembly chaperone [Lacibacter sp.]|jgi:cbb3-type cytochrome oxidase subunit 3
MFKFIKKYAETIENIEIYPIISLLIFFAFFVGVLWYVLRLRQSDVNNMKQLPLDDQP